MALSWLKSLWKSSALRSPSASLTGISEIKRRPDKPAVARRKLQEYFGTVPEGKRALNVGCGSQPMAGWLNIDLGGAPDLVWDLSVPMDFLPAGSFDYVYSEHLLEHFDRKEGMRLLLEWNRILRPGGYVRIAMPDLDFALEMYQKGWDSAHACYSEEFKEHYGDALYTRGEMLDICLRGWGHRYLYNEEDVRALLKKTGFVDDLRLENGQSTHSMLHGIETRPPEQSRLIVEARKALS